MRVITLLFLFITSFASAQISDGFTDGDFTNNPTWSGDVADFTINATHQLQTNAAVAGASYLSTPSYQSSLNNTEWKFYIKVSFSPSSTNYGRVYLASNQANLEGSLNGYYLQFGETGSLDAVQLFRQTGVASVSVCRGTDGQVANAFAIGVRVTIDNSGVWTLYVDGAGGTNYTQQAQGTDATYTSSSFFGVASVYTVSNSTKFFFDDFYNGAIVVDVTPPTLVSALTVSSTQVDVLFNETVDITTSQIVSNYVADNGLGSPASAVRDGSNLALVHLTYSTPFTANLQYSLAVSNVQDASGNPMVTGSLNFTYVVSATPGYKNVIINEIFADPSPQIGLPLVEFIEVYNTTNNAFNLNGWKFTDGTSTATLGNYTLGANQYLIICPIADTAQFTPFGNKIGVSSFPSLNNTGDNLKLKDNTLTVIDSVDYLDTWYQDVVKKDGGWTLELINPSLPSTCPSTGNWTASNNPGGGTPGTQNSVYSTSPDVVPPSIIDVSAIDATHVSVCFNEGIDVTTASLLTNYNLSNGIGNPIAASLNSTLTCVTLTLASPLTSATTYTITTNSISDCTGNSMNLSSSAFTYYTVSTAGYKDVVINEIFADPSPIINLPTGEFIELYNKSSTLAYNLTGWQITDGTSTGTLGNYILTPNKYVIVCAALDVPAYNAFGQVIGLSTWPSLNNSGDNLKLKDNNAVLIDSVGYSDAWYQDAIKKDGGWTLELINPLKPLTCPSTGNWIASNNTNGGTPGTQNSVYSTAPDITSPSITGAIATDSTHISLCFSEAIDITQLTNISNYSITNSTITPISAIANASLTCVDLTLLAALQLGTTYTLSLNTVSDCSGNILSTSSVAFSYYIPRMFDVVINEIMADQSPIVNLPEFEYVELYNRSSFAINLNGWGFSANTTNAILPNIILQGHSYVTLASTSAAPNYPAINHVVGITSFPGLTNTGATLTLRTPANVVMSTVDYTDAWYQNTSKKDGGWSLEQIDPNNPCAGMSNWRASNNVNGGTPGFVNSVNAANPDHTSPQVIRVALIALDTIQVYFDEPLNPITMLSITSYSVNNNVGLPTSVIPIPPDNKSIKLAFANAFQEDKIYTITINNIITDCVGNILSSDNTAQFAIPKAASPGNIIINEILNDPNTGGYDYVEIYNKSDKVIDLKTIRLSQFDSINNIPTSIKTISTDGYLFFPKQYLVLTANSSAVKSQYYTPNPKGFIDLPSMITMNITSGTVCLSTNDSIIDLLSYYESMHFALLNSTKGVSLERISFNRATNDLSNWHSAAEAVGFGTPGYLNSQYNEAGEATDAFEITPEVFSPDEDGFNDIVNIIYKFNTPGYVANVQIFDSKGRLVRNLVRNEYLGIKGTFSWDGITDDKDKARIGIYIIYIEVFDLSGNVKKYKKTCVVASRL